MRQTVGIEAFLVNLSCLELPYETLLLIDIDEILNIHETSLGLEVIYASWDVQAENDAAHIKHYCLNHNKSLSGQIYVFIAEL